MTQLATATLEEAHQTPPPCSPEAAPLLRVAPRCKVNPTKAALFVSQAQRTAAGPFVEPGSHAP